MMEIEGLIHVHLDKHKLSLAVEPPYDIGSDTTRKLEINMSKFTENKPALTYEEQQKALNEQLLLAIKENNKNAVKQSIEDGAELNIGIGGINPLFKTIERGHTEIIELLVEKLVKDGHDINTFRQYGKNLLLHAVDYGRTEITKILIDNGADVNTQGGGDSPLWRAENNTEMKQLLLEAGAGINTQVGGGNISSSLSLLVAAFCGDTTKVATLLDQGAYIESREEHGDTPLLLALRNHNLETSELLINRGADVDGLYVNGHTTRSLAFEKAKIPTVRFLATHYRHLDKIAEYIERFEINNEPSTLTREDRQSFIKDATKFNEANIATALAKRLAKASSPPEITGEERALLVERQAKDITHKAIKQYKAELAERLHNRTKRDRDNGSFISFLPNDVSAEIGAFLNNSDFLSARVAFATKVKKDGQSR